MFKVDLQHDAFSNKWDQYEEWKRIKGNATEQDGSETWRVRMAG